MPAAQITQSGAAVNRQLGGLICDHNERLSRVSHDRGAVTVGNEAAPAPTFPPESFASRLDGCATALIYGRDLLHTRLATTAHGERRALSDWAPVISSAALKPHARLLVAGRPCRRGGTTGGQAGKPGTCCCSSPVWRARRPRWGRRGIGSFLVVAGDSPLRAFT
jgi:hypothetical protein